MIPVLVGLALLVGAAELSEAGRAGPREAGVAATTARPGARSAGVIPASARDDRWAPKTTEPGRLEAFTAQGATPLPLLAQEAHVVVRGELAEVRLVQRFQNPLQLPVHARYVFPLPPDAAVVAMKLRTADEVVEAEIREKEEAKAVFAQAKAEGKQAALVEQLRPDVFTQSISNLVPGAPISVELRYVHTIVRRDGAWLFHLPTVVGPRYDGPQSTGTPAELPFPAVPQPLVAGAPAAEGRPAAPSSAAPTIGLTLELDAGLPVTSLESPTHALVVEAPSASRRVVRLAGAVAADRDLVLRWTLAGADVGTGAVAASDGTTGVLSLVIEPPAALQGQAVTPREVVLLLDCSGSMHGAPLEASKRLGRRLLTTLRPTDTFRIVRFSDQAGEFAARPLPASPENVEDGLAFLDGLDGEGGTDMAAGIRAALGPKTPEGTLRLVVFLTDGYIGDDAAVIRLVEAERDGARLFAFGVGAAVNRWLLEELGRVGRGTTRVVLPHEDPLEAAELLAHRLEAPLLTDLSIDWGTLQVEGAMPALLPDLFFGDAVRVIARYHEGGSHLVRINGRSGGEPVSLPLQLQLPPPGRRTEGDALPSLWARAQVEDRMQRLLHPSATPEDRAALQQDVTQLGLQYHLVTQWTSLVAVAKRIVVEPGTAKELEVPRAPVQGVDGRAYATGAPFGGSAAPEPATMLGAGALASLAAAALRRRRRAQGGVSSSRR